MKRGLETSQCSRSCWVNCAWAHIKATLTLERLAAEAYHSSVTSFSSAQTVFQFLFNPLLPKYTSPLVMMWRAVPFFISVCVTMCDTGVLVKGVKIQCHNVVTATAMQPRGTQFGDWCSAALDMKYSRALPVMYIHDLSKLQPTKCFPTDFFQHHAIKTTTTTFVLTMKGREGIECPPPSLYNVIEWRTMVKLWQLMIQHALH